MNQSSKIVVGIILAVSLAGCGRKPQPSANDVKWSVTRTADQKAYVLKGRATYTDGLDGWYDANVTLVDDRGCEASFLTAATNVPAKDEAGTMAGSFDETYKLRRPVARATLAITFHQTQYRSFDPDAGKTEVFSAEQTVDPSLHPPETPINPCSAPLTPDQKLERLPRNRQVALAINSAGFLCARVTDLYPDSAGQIIVHCVEYLSGRGRVKYRIDADAGRVEKLE